MLRINVDNSSLPEIYKWNDSVDYIFESNFKLKDSDIEDIVEEYLQNRFDKSIDDIDSIIDELPIIEENNETLEKEVNDLKDDLQIAKDEIIELKEQIELLRKDLS